LYLSSSIGIDEDEASFERRSHLAIQAAAARGYVPAVYTMGLRYLFGDHVESDATAAVKCFSMASDAGYPAAMYEMGLALFHGVGVMQDVPEALSLIRKSAAGGDEYAMEFLAAYDVGG
jgi:TPR repeat protein